MDVLGFIKCIKNYFLLINGRVRISGYICMRQAGELEMGPVTPYVGDLWLSDHSFVFSWKNKLIFTLLFFFVNCDNHAFIENNTTSISVLVS